MRAELDKVQERIESYKGRIRVWDSLVDYSTVTYNIRPVVTLDTEDDSPRLIKLDETWRAMKRGFKKLRNSCCELLLVLIQGTGDTVLYRL